METKGYLKKYITAGVHQVKIVKLYDIKEDMNKFNGKLEKSRGAVIKWADDLFIEYIKEKDFYMMEEGATLIAIREEYKGNPFIKWNVPGDISTQSQNIGAPKMLDKEKADKKEIQFNDDQKQKELSIVTQSVMHIPGHYQTFIELEGHGEWCNYVKQSIDQAKTLLLLVKEDLNG